MFFRKTPESKPEPTEEQLREEQEFAERNVAPPPKSRPRSITTETQEIVQNTLQELDKAIEEKRRLKSQAKKVQESCNEASGVLRLRKA
jgi:hypothetical protein